MSVAVGGHDPSVDVADPGTTVRRLADEGENTLHHIGGHEPGHHSGDAEIVGQEVKELPPGDH